jgi:peptide/nickel transport system substrate-binding protein
MVSRSPTAWCWRRWARPAPRCRDHAREGRADRSEHADQGGDRLRSLHVRQGPVGPGQQGRLSQEQADYVPRKEAPVGFFAGGKIPGVDRIELVWISDPQTAMQALVNGEIDFYEQPPIDFLPMLEKAKRREADEDRRDRQHFGMIRLNHLHPPFNNIKARQAMYTSSTRKTSCAPSWAIPNTTRSATASSPAARRWRTTPAASGWPSTIPRRPCSCSRRPATRASRSPSCTRPTTHTITPATQVLIQAMREAG